MRPIRQGLIVGKFSPLHKGHERLIRTATGQGERLTVISWAKPEYPGCAAAERERWLATLFPTVDRLVLDDARVAALQAKGAAVPALPDDSADVDVHREFVGLLCRDVLGIHVDAVFTGESYGDGFAASLTAQARRLDPAAQDVRHVLVDRERRDVEISSAGGSSAISATGISATAIRRDVHGHRAWLSPDVYASFVRRVCILGGESSGKTSLARGLAEQLGTVWVPEYGRELWEARGGKLEFDDLLAIAVRQVAMEEAARREAYRWVICDTSPLTTLQYCLDLFGRADPWLEELAARPYDVTILCANDLQFVQDGTRRDEAFRERQHEWYVRDLGRRHVPFVTVEGGLEERILAVVSVLED